jgi:ABC-type nitrate/sulfonate/bicarbonate transport system substrate-binding protein
MNGFRMGAQRRRAQVYAAAAVAVITGGLIAGCSSGSPSPSSGGTANLSGSKAVTTVSYGFTAPVASFLPAWIAGEQPSICAPFGIKINPVSLSHNAGITALISGSVQLSETSSASALQAGIQASSQLQAVALTGPKASSLYAAKDINSLADFKGKSISATSKGSTSDAQIRVELAGAGLYEGKDYSIVYTTSQQAMVALAVTGKTVGFPIVPPVDATVTKAGYHQLLGNPASGTPLALVSRDAIMANPSYANSHQQVITNALKCLDASITYIGTHPAQRDAALVKYMGIPQSQAESVYATNKLTYEQLTPFTLDDANNIISEMTKVGVFATGAFNGFSPSKILNSTYLAG